MGSLPEKPDGEYALACPQWTDVAVNVAFSGTTARVASPLDDGLYLITPTAACYFLQGGSTVNAAASTSHYMPADVPRYVMVSGTDNAYIAAIQVSTTGTLFISQQKPT